MAVHARTAPLNAYTLVLFSPVEWAGLHQRPHHLARQMMGSFGSVIFVQPAGLRPIKFQDWKRVCSWAAGRITSRLPWASPRHGGRDEPHICSPSFAPFSGLNWADRYNSFICRRALQARIAGFSQNKILFWVSSPVPYLPSLLSEFPDSSVVFDWIDDVRLFAHSSPRVEACLHYLLTTSDFVFASAQRLHDQALQYRKPGSLAVLSNGVDVSHWCHPPENPKPPHPMDSFPPGPIIGYFGTISHWIDFDLVAKMASACPQWQFVFIGPVSHAPGFHDLIESKNIHWIREQPYNRLPEFSHFFDAAWLPFRTDGLRATINPVKIYEYLAAGKPVVASPLPDLIDLQPGVNIAESAFDFIQRISALLNAQDETMVKERRSIAEMHSWDRLWRKAEQRLVENIVLGKA